MIVIGCNLLKRERERETEGERERTTSYIMRESERGGGEGQMLAVGSNGLLTHAIVSMI